MLTVKSTINIAGQTVPEIIPVVQGDTGRSILFTLADFTIPTGATATYYIQKPSGDAIYNAATIDGNKVLVELTAQSVAESGDNFGQVRISANDEVVTSFDFILLVKKFRGIDATESTTEMNIFDQAVDQAETEITAAKEAALEEIAQAGSGSVADEFDSTATYAAGDYVIYNAKLYYFTSAHTGAWTGSDATETTVGTQLTDVESDLNQAKQDLTAKPDVETPIETDADLYLSDENGNVIAMFEDGHIKTKEFDSSATTSGVETYYTEAQTVVSGTANTFVISHNFSKGDKVVFHMDDGLGHMAYGKYGYYYEGSTVIAANRKGTNGYFEHIITADCSSVKVIINSGQYDAGTTLRLYVYLIKEEVKPKIITVKSDGTGMYTTLKAAVDSITDANHVTNPYVIEIYPGTYNTLEGYSDEVIATADSSAASGTTFQGQMITNGISLRGMGGTPDEVVLTATLSTSDWSSTVRGAISTINMQGTGSLENLTVDGNNLRYSVHDDFATPANERRLRTIRNCKFTGSNLSSTPHMTTYGAGCGYPRQYLIENCDFGYGIGIHTQGGYTSGMTAIMNNCIGHHFSIGDVATASSDAVSDFIVNNCEFDNIVIAHRNEVSGQHIRLIGVGNENTFIKCDTSDIYQINTVKTVSGFSVGQMVAKVNGATFYGSYEATTNPEIAFGIVVFADSDYSYIQRRGYIASNLLGLTGLSLGDYVTVNSNGVVVTGGTSANAVGVVKWVDDDGYAYIKMMI